MSCQKSWKKNDDTLIMIKLKYLKIGALSTKILEIVWKSIFKIENVS